MLSKFFVAGLACLAPLASAYTKPTGDAPKGNPISEPGLHSIVPAGEEFTVTWKPTTEGTVSILLLKGPSNNAIPQYPIAEGIKNSGTFNWTPKTDLQPNITGYGLQLIVDATGQYQYTTQFGISNPDYKESDSFSSSSPESKPTDQPFPYPHSSDWASATRNYTAPSATSAPSRGGFSNSTTAAPTASDHSQPTSATAVNPSTTPSNTTGSASFPTPTNGASGLATSFAGLVVAAGVALFVL